MKDDGGEGMEKVMDVDTIHDEYVDDVVEVLYDFADQPGFNRMRALNQDQLYELAEAIVEALYE